MLVPSVSIRTDDLSLTGGLRCQLRYEGIDWIHTPMRRVRKHVAGTEGLEPPTSGFGDQRSAN